MLPSLEVVCASGWPDHSGLAHVVINGRMMITLGTTLAERMIDRSIDRGPLGEELCPLSSFRQPYTYFLPTGESNTVVSPTVPGGLSDGQWHTVHLRYYNKVGTILTWEWGGELGCQFPPLRDFSGGSC